MVGILSPASKNGEKLISKEHQTKYFGLFIMLTFAQKFIEEIMNMKNLTI